MKIIFAVVSLLLALAVIGMLAKTQLGSLRSAAGDAAPASGAATGARQIEQKIKDDVTRLMRDAPQRNESAQ